HSLCKNKSNIDGIYSFFEYKDIIRKAIIEFKFKYVTDLEESFWKIIFNEIERKRQDYFLLNKYLLEKKPTIVSVPLFWYKQNLRGFNQSSAFGKRLAYLYNLPFSEKIIIRAKSSKPQAKLTQTQRKENLKGIFEINKNIDISGKNFVIFDDILTTGSTIKEINKVLKENKAGEVWGLTIAR
ncbi:MAG: phosphoribosyltransferase family protein, partial [Candidatus Woesebacteria bacterium]|nr:phosphoribosyltransferase family protein [Candidatus Woesebacteria bacterium]